jgi:nucleoside-diphosphate-sugar epimerase
MKVAISGANGFLGSWICRVLSEDHQVVGLVRPGAKKRKLHGIRNIDIKILEESHFNKVISEISPDVVILCDWWGVGSEFRNDDFQFTNIERIRKRISSLKYVPTVIGVGSQAEVGPKSNVIGENELDSPTTKYGLAKVEARKVIESTLDSKVRFVWGRIFSTYGPLDSETWFIPDTIRKLLSNQSVALTKGEQEWSFLHAYDLGRAFKSIIENNQIVGTVNIGHPETKTIFQVATFIGDLLDKRKLLDFGRVPYREDQVMRLAPATESLSRFGWTPKIKLETGIAHLISWMTAVDAVGLNTIDNQAINLSLPNYDSIK